MSFPRSISAHNTHSVGVQTARALVGDPRGKDEFSSDRRAGSCWQPLASLRRVTPGAELRIVLDDSRRGTLP